MYGSMPGNGDLIGGSSAGTGDGTGQNTAHATSLASEVRRRFAFRRRNGYAGTQSLAHPGRPSRASPMFRRALLAGLPLAVLVLALPSPAQRSGTLKPTVFAVRDARVVVEPGRVLPKATVVIRDGLIEAVGADVKPPADALVTDGSGLTVYPGFIDALSNWGFDPALRRSEVGPTAPEDFASEALAATKADNRKGLTPEFAVSTAFKTEDEIADGWRKAGFTAHLIAPDGGIIVGTSVLVSLSGTAPREAMLRSPVAMHASFRTVFGAGGDYPRAL